MERGKKFVDDDRFVIHPDIKHITQNYKGDRRVFPELFKKRDQILDEGGVFWETDHDVEMTEVAKQRTDQATAEGWRYPVKKKK